MIKSAKPGPARAPICDELEAMSKCYEVLKKLPLVSIMEVMGWLHNRIESERK